MAEITAKLVNELRAKTGQPMMECKRALSEVGGDLDKAIEYFRKKGVKASLGERAASEGRVVGVVSEDKKAGALVEVNCNTDFTAKSEPVLKLAAKAARLLLHHPDTDIAQAVTADLTEAAQTTGENVRIGKTAYLASPGTVGLYHYTISGKIAVLMSFTGTEPSEEVIRNVGGHIAFARPAGLTRQDLPPDLVAKEREFAVEQAKATGKPQNIAEKIAEGKLNSFYADRVLLDQEFFNSQLFKGTVAQYLKSHGLTLEKYVRIEVGQ